MAVPSEKGRKPDSPPAGEDVKGVAGRDALRRHGLQPASGECVRKALQRVGRKPAETAGSNAPRPLGSRPSASTDKREGPSLQALLGSLAAADGAVDLADAARLGEVLRGMSDPQLERLGRLAAAVRTAREERGAVRPPALDRLNDRLAAAGVNLDVNCKTTIINIGGDRPAPDDGKRSRGPRRQYSWGRYLGGKVRNFLDGR